MWCISCYCVSFKKKLLLAKSYIEYNICSYTIIYTEDMTFDHSPLHTMDFQIQSKCFPLFVVSLSLCSIWWIFPSILYSYFTYGIHTTYMLKWYTYRGWSVLFCSSYRRPWSFTVCSTSPIALLCFLIDCPWDSYCLSGTENVNPITIHTLALGWMAQYQ